MDIHSSRTLFKPLFVSQPLHATIHQHNTTKCFFLKLLFTSEVEDIIEHRRGGPLLRKKEAIQASSRSHLTLGCTLTQPLYYYLSRCYAAQTYVITVTIISSRSGRIFENSAEFARVSNETVEILVVIILKSIVLVS